METSGAHHGTYHTISKEVNQMKVNQMKVNQKRASKNDITPEDPLLDQIGIRHAKDQRLF
jgi:hypothetical protein